MNHLKNLVHVEAWTELFVERFSKIIVIVVIVMACAKLIRMVCRQLMVFAHKATHNGERHALDREKRLNTVVGLVDTTLRILLLGAGFLMVLRELGLDITPFLTGAGIAGVALGFGAQSLVKDVISGFFLLLEDQMRVGDVVKVNSSLSGSVERMQLRTTALRDGDGTLHVIPNGEIKAVSNMTYDFGQAVVDIPVRYDVDLKKLISILEEVAAAFNQDPAWKGRLLGPASVAGIVDFKPTHMLAELTAKTEASARWSVAGELRRRTKIALEAHGQAFLPGITLP